MDNNNKKRQRLESSGWKIGAMGSSMEPLSSFTSPPESIILNSNQNVAEGGIDLGAALPANLYFTICDDISNESHDFLAINNSTAVTHIKEEPKRDSGLCEAPLQYRIVSQVPKTSGNSSSSATTAVTLRAVSLDGTRSNTNVTPVDTASILPATTVQLPSGCEIYLVKEYVDSESGEILLSEDCEEPLQPQRMTLPQSVGVNNSAVQSIIKSPSVSILPRTSIKTEPGTLTQFLGSNVITSKIENTPLKATAGSVASNYKKRDEKRRATHNEVERRRRDKINSWIFKLKEMLPTDNSNSGFVSKSKSNHTRNNDTVAAAHQSGASRSTSGPDDVEMSQKIQTAQHRGGNNCRSPPNDSKSQILIKACEYIRAMQDEVKSLRECLTENEKLRMSNIRLQNELQKLKNSEQHRLTKDQQQQHSCNDNFNNNKNCNCPSEDFTLTLCTNGNSHLDDVTNSTLFTATPTSPTSITLINGRKAAITVPYTKRELIITDYVD